NALQHIQGYLKKRIDGGDKQELGESIDAYRRDEVPLVVPMRLLRHYFRRNPDSYIDRQWYLDPYPESLGLRNTI
ncbi:MAG: YbgA family protein, partial [Sedimenticolaceae bacterium]